MARYKMLAFSRPAAGREDEYNDWYQNHHLQQVLNLPGFVSAQRYRLSRKLVEGDAEPYLTMYTIETDDIDTSLQAMRDAAGTPELEISTALDTEAVEAVVYEEFGKVLTK